MMTWACVEVDEWMIFVFIGVDKYELILRAIICSLNSEGVKYAISWDCRLLNKIRFLLF